MKLPLRFCAILAAVMAITWLSLAPAEAQLGSDEATIVHELTGQQVLTILNSEGYVGGEVNENGNVTFKLEGRKAVIFTAKDHKSIQFWMGWNSDTSSLEKVNAWNQTKRYSRAYLDREGDPILELDLDLAGGVTVARVKDFLMTARVSVPSFIEQVVN